MQTGVMVLTKNKSPDFVLKEMEELYQMMGGCRDVIFSKRWD